MAKPKPGRLHCVTDTFSALQTHHHHHHCHPTLPRRRPLVEREYKQKPARLWVDCISSSASAYVLVSLECLPHYHPKTTPPADDNSRCAHLPVLLKARGLHLHIGISLEHILKQLLCLSQLRINPNFHTPVPQFETRETGSVRILSPSQHTPPGVQSRRRDGQQIWSQRHLASQKQQTLPRSPSIDWHRHCFLFRCAPEPSTSWQPGSVTAVRSRLRSTTYKEEDIR